MNRVSPGLTLSSAAWGSRDAGLGFDWSGVVDAVGTAAQAYTQYKAHEDELKAQAKRDLLNMQATLNRPPGQTAAGQFLSGINTNTMLLVGGVAIVGLLLLSRRR
jgi:hypothetical protein